MGKDTHLDKVPEPIEVRLLKQKLACFACKCLNCEKYSRDSRLNKIKNGESTGVQVDKTISDRLSKITAYNRMDEKSKKVDKATGNSFISNLCNNYICPSCHYIVEFLRGHLNKVFKDVETETNPLVRCNKSTEKTVDHLDKTTSMIKCDLSCPKKNKLSAERKCDKVVFGDSKRDSASDVENIIKVGIENEKKYNTGKYKIANMEKGNTVFIDNQSSSDTERTMFSNSKHTSVSKQYTCGNCVCVEKFINAIRPYA